MTITALNGRLPDAMLAVVDTGPNGPQRLLLTVAPIWAAMLAAGMPAGCLRSGYRTLGQQASEVTAASTGATPLAAPVGQSQHGEGLAADIDEPARTWAHAHAGVYGLRFPIVVEPWHCELDQAHIPPPPAPTPPALKATTPPEDDMARLVKHPNGSIAIVGPGTAFTILHTMDQVNTALGLGVVTNPDYISLPNPQMWDIWSALAKSANTFNA